MNLENILIWKYQLAPFWKEDSGKTYFLKFNLNRYIQKESLDSSWQCSGASERLQLWHNRYGKKDTV